MEGVSLKEDQDGQPHSSWLTLAYRTDVPPPSESFANPSQRSESFIFMAIPFLEGFGALSPL
jgi:hypothetical protein